MTANRKAKQVRWQGDQEGAFQAGRPQRTCLVCAGVLVYRKQRQGYFASKVAEGCFMEGFVHFGKTGFYLEWAACLCRVLREVVLKRSVGHCAEEQGQKNPGT
jgi:hypothetical protein